jgi:serine/threonine protein kinase
MTDPGAPQPPLAGDTLPVQPGETLAGRYRVERLLGAGGMGVVVAATHLELGQRVALKFLLPFALHNPEAVARFLREARAAVQIVSEHVARVTDVGRLDNGAPYMVMEYLEGVDLSQYPRHPPIPVETAVGFVLQACEAIAVAHSLGIVHRDLKPANLFLTTRPDGSQLVKVLDFGISKLLEAEHGAVDLTRTAALLGSPLYMSPEQIESSRSVDVRTDVWALGTILHDLLTGQPPFPGDSFGAVFAAVLKSPPSPLRAFRPDVPERLERVVLTALEKEPARRFPNVGELALALAEFAPGSRVSVDRARGVLSRAGSSSPPGVGGVAAVTNGEADGTGTAWEEQGRQQSSRARRSRWVFGAGLLAASLGVGIGVVRLLRPVPPSIEPVASGAAAVLHPQDASAGVSVQPPVVTPAPSVAPMTTTAMVAQLPAASASAHPSVPKRPPSVKSANPAPTAKNPNPLSIDFK